MYYERISQIKETFFVNLSHNYFLLLSARPTHSSCTRLLQATKQTYHFLLFYYYLYFYCLSTYKEMCASQVAKCPLDYHDTQLTLLSFFIYLSFSNYTSLKMHLIWFQQFFFISTFSFNSLFISEILTCYKLI